MALNALSKLTLRNSTSDSDTSMSPQEALEYSELIEAIIAEIGMDFDKKYISNYAKFNMFNNLNCFDGLRNCITLYATTNYEDIKTRNLHIHTLFEKIMILENKLEGKYIPTFPEILAMMKYT